MATSYVYLVYIISHVFGVAFCWHTPGPDNQHTVVHQLGSLLLLIAWLASTFSYGVALTEALKIRRSRFVLSLFFGTICMSLVAYLLAFTGLVHEKFRILYHLLILLGPVYLYLRKLQFPRSPIPLVSFSFLILLALFIPRLVLSSTPSSHWDALWYHLPSMQNWWAAGGYKYSSESIAVFHSGSWETLYLWPFLLLGGRDGQGLVLIHIFAQWQHLILGFVGSFFCLEQLTRLFAPKRWVSVVVAGGLMSFSLLHVSTYAKNDWGIIFWTLSLFLILIRHRNVGLYLPLLTGFLLGFTLSSKWSSISSMIAILAFLFFSMKICSWRKVASFSGAVLCGMLPILVRNTIFLEAPTFPLGAVLYSTDLIGPTYRAAFSAYTSFDLDGLVIGMLTKLKIVMSVNPLFYALLLVPVNAWLGNKALSRRVLQLFLVLAFLPFLLNSYDKLEPRILGALLILLNLTASAEIAVFLNRILGYAGEWKGAFNLVLCFFALLFLVPDHYIRQPSIRNIELLRPELTIRTHLAGSSMAWVRLNVPTNEKILLPLEGKTFYLSTHSVVRIWDWGYLDKKIVEAKNFEERVAILVDEGFDIAIIGAMRIDRFYNEAIVDEFSAAWKEYDGSVLYAAKYSRVISLKKMLEEIRSKQ